MYVNGNVFILSNFRLSLDINNYWRSKVEDLLHAKKFPGVTCAVLFENSLPCFISCCHLDLSLGASVICLLLPLQPALSLLPSSFLVLPKHKCVYCPTLVFLPRESRNRGLVRLLSVRIAQSRTWLKWQPQPLILAPTVCTAPHGPLCLKCPFHLTPSPLPTTSGPRLNSTISSSRKAVIKCFQTRWHQQLSSVSSRLHFIISGFSAFDFPLPSA